MTYIVVITLLIFKSEKIGGITDINLLLSILWEKNREHETRVLYAFLC